MSSALTWLDYSERDRRRMLDLIYLLRQKETRDELGIGGVRDAFADMLFPGTSTIQTRARYFLFVPWIYRDLERRRIRSSQVAAEARKREVRLTDAIIGSEDSDGVFGKRSRSNLKRLPSSVYWGGLGIWNIRLFPGSKDQYHRSLDGFYATKRLALRTDDGEPVDDVVRNWHAGLPSAPPDFLKEASFRLTRAEAEYLRERIVVSVPGTLLAFLVDHGRAGDTAQFPWIHPQRGEYPVHVRKQLHHARNFSEVIHGSALLYNLMLAQSKGDDELIDGYRARLDRWAETVESRQGEFARWDLQDFWTTVTSGGVRVAPAARVFVDRWLEIALAPGVAGRIPENEAARRLISDRELALKGALARLHHQSALELWNEASGIYQLDYRWDNAQKIVEDILRGLQE